MKRYAATLCVAACAAMLACGGSAGNTITNPPEAKPTVSIANLALEARVEDYPNTLLRATGTVKDAQGNPVSSGFSWEINSTPTSSNPSLETVLPPGTHKLCLVFQGVKDCRDVVIEAPKPLTGKVLVASSGNVTSVPPLRVCAQWGSLTECVDVTSLGSYSLMTKLVRGTTVVLTAECKVANCGFIPSVDTVSTDSLSTSTGKNLVVLEKNWTIRSGRWAGTTVKLSLEKAYAKGGDSLSFYFRALQSFWRTQDLPIKVALDRQGSPGISITAQDSVSMWKFLDEEMAELGKQFFIPADVEELEVFRGDPGQLPAFLGGIGVVVRNDSLGALSGAHWAHPIKGPTDYLTGCQVQLSLHPLSSFKERLVVKHEFFHCLGFGHTPKESWFPGLMTNRQNRANPLYGFLIPEEIAYQQAWYAVSELRVGQKASGMPQLLSGERMALSGAQQAKAP